MKKITILYFLMLCILVACKDDDKTAEELLNRTVFTFKFGHLDNVEDVWIVVRDNETGDLIGAEQILDNTTTEFESTKKITNDELAVTLFRTGIGPSKHRYAKVYYHIPVGTAWTFGVASDIDVREPGGEAPQQMVTINNLIDPFSLTISDEFGRINYARGHGPDNRTEYVRAHENSEEKYLISVDPAEGQPRYAWVNNLNDLIIDYNTFEDFDKTVTFTFPKTGAISAKVIGYTTPATGDSYNLYEYDHVDAPSTASETTELTFGFLDEFSFYSVEVDLFPFHYSSRGPAPQAIEYTSDSKDFLYFTTEHINWETNDIVDYISPKALETTHDPLTPEILAKYSFDHSALERLGSSYVVQGRSYEEFLRASFDLTYDINTPYYESSVFAFWP